MVELYNNISDEMLAAYIDSNATPLECLIIGDAVNNEDIIEVMDIISDIRNSSDLLLEDEYFELKVIEESLNRMEQFNELKRKFNEDQVNNIK